MRPIVHIVPHTHWDREWYHGAARFQLRLARLIDDLLERLERRELPAFLLDGQGIVLDDYAALRPGDRLRKPLASGRLECGPWYVLADNLTVSGEALVRNLLEGGRAVGRYGGRPMTVGYAPDAFGHPAILPTLFAGFGIRTAVTWRGFGGERGQEKDLYRWRGPDGAEVVMIHLPPPGYEYGANLPPGKAEAKKRWAALAALLEPRARSPHWLVLNGADHHAAQAGLPAAVSQLRRVAPQLEFAIGTLGDYARAVEAWAEDHDLPLLEGELRAGRRHAWALQGTFSSRSWLKQRNAECQRLLERIAEPLASLAVARGTAAAEPRAELQAAWRTLLENHPHDSICGTSTDAVHREMDSRFARCREQADEIARRALDAALGHDADRAREAGHDAWRPALLVFNPAPEQQDAVVELDVERFVAHEPVGPGSAHPAGAEPVMPGPLVLRDARGRAVPHQLLGRARTRPSLVESPRHYPDCDVVLAERVAIAVRDLPPLGVAALRVESGPARGRKRPTPYALRPVEVSGLELSNEFLRARVEQDGEIAMARIGGGWNTHGLARLELMADAGDSYTSAPRGADLAAFAGVAGDVLHAGPLVGELRVWRDLAGEYPQPWSLYQPLHVRLLAGEPFLRLTMARQWLGSALRLRMAFDLGERPRRVVADGPFGPVERRPGVARPALRGETEATPATAPMQRYVSLAGARTGMTVFADGLQEYEARPDGTLLVTLERTFAEVSRSRLPERPGHASWPSRAGEGPSARPPYRLAVMLHDPRELERRTGIEQAASAFFAAPVGYMRRASLSVPAPVRGPRLAGPGLVFSAMKPADAGEGIILRCYNALNETVGGSWSIPWAVRSARRCRLDERPGATLKVGKGGRVAFNAGPREIVTILVR